MKSTIDEIVESSASNDPQPVASNLMIVAIGASAGGLHSLEQFFEAVPSDSGIAFVIIQHLSPDFESVMDQLLGRRTEIPILQASDGLALSANTIYLIPPKNEAIVSAGRFRLRDKEPKQTLSLPINQFFRSLAQNSGASCVAVVLSGSGSDGSRGIIDIHDAGGYVIVESEESAAFSSMPKSAQATGVVDEVLEPGAIPTAIFRWLSSEPSNESAEIIELEVGIELIYQMLNREHGIDFSHYKASTVNRRIHRRIEMCRFPSVNAYAEHLKENPKELSSLYHDLLIGVTRFFRDPDAFSVLERFTIPEVFDRVDPDDEIRIWIAGVATGEEAYSIAMLFHDEFAFRNRPVKLKIFATDVHKGSLEIASVGKYSADAMEMVSEQRLEKYFYLNGQSYVVDATLRRSIVFAPHNVIGDAPFTRLDFLACRNLLIYFQPQAQKKALSMFHFGLKTGAMMMLGPSESPGDFAEEFDVVDEKWNLFRKRRDIRLTTHLIQPSESRRPSVPVSSPATTSYGPPSRSLIGAYDWMLARYMPAAILIDDQHNLVHVSGNAKQFLQVQSGRPSQDCLDLFTGELHTAIVAGVHRVRKDRKTTCYTGVPIRSDNATKLYRVSVIPVENDRAQFPQMLISFEEEDGHGEVELPGRGPGDVVAAGFQAVSADHLASLEKELRYTQESLHATVEQLGASNEELQSTNEELIASNEELQSTNEELHSVNEELYTVNAEYQTKIHDLTELTADLDNLMTSTEVATMFLDDGLRIRRVTKQISQFFDLLPQDVGRTIASFAHHLDRPSLIEDLQHVLATGEPLEVEVQNHDAQSFLLRMLPYRKGDLIDGVVLALIDVTMLKLARDKLADAIEDRERFLAMLSHEMRNPINAVLSASSVIDAECKLKNEDGILSAAAVIRRQSAHLARLLDDLLDISRVTQDKLEFRKQLIDLGAAVHDAIESAESFLAAREQTLDADVTSLALPLSGDTDRLRQVFVNLLGNASKYSPIGSTISMTVKRHPDTVEILVVDQGDGITSDMLASVFDPFVQSNRTRDSREGGMGVGLALVKFIVEAHDGSIAVESGGPGEGSAFLVTLPLSVLVETRDGAMSLSASGLDGFPHHATVDDAQVKTVLIVEDERDSREMLEALLKLEGFEVLTAASGEEGIQKILASKPDVALIDIGLPNTSGYEVAKTVRNTLGRSILLIALTGHGLPDDLQSAYDAGYDEHIVKPLDFDRLMRLLGEPNRLR